MASLIENAALRAAEEQRRAGLLEEALEAYDALLVIAPKHAEALSGRGATLARMGKFKDAIACFEAALEQDPKLVKARFNIGLANQQLGRLDAAREAFEEVLEVDPHHGRAMAQLAILSAESGDTAQGVARFEKALTEGDSPLLRHNFATLLARAGRHAEALEHFDRAIEMAPASTESWRGRAASRRVLGDAAGAIDDYDEVLERVPDDFRALLAQGALLRELGELTDAVASLEYALELKPDSGLATAELGATYRDAGLIKGALVQLEKAVELDPRSLEARQHRLAALVLRGGDADEIEDAHVAVGDLVSAAVEPLPRGATQADPARLLRVGYLVGDPERREVDGFVAPLLEAHDRAQVLPLVYVDSPKGSEAHTRLAAHAACVDVTGQNDAWVAARMREDGVDVLLELTGHGRRSRLAVAAMRPCPLALSYLGWPGTTGLAEIAGRIGDAVVDPDDGDEMEAIARLQAGAFCWRVDGAPTVDPSPPSTETGRITYASFAPPAKITGRTLRTWARILTKTPGSKLHLEGPAWGDKMARRRVRRALEKAELPVKRVRMRASHGRAARLESLAEIDIVLDSFPWSDRASACEALWMGAPVVTLRGETAAGRETASVLTRVGLDELVADSAKDYVARCLKLARDERRLKALRRTLRERVQTSALGDAKVFTRGLEKLIRDAWKALCEDPEGA